MRLCGGLVTLGVTKQLPDYIFPLSSLELSDTNAYEPSSRALLGTASHFCEIVVLAWGAHNLGVAARLPALADDRAVAVPPAAQGCVLSVYHYRFCHPPAACGCVISSILTGFTTPQLFRVVFLPLPVLSPPSR